ncbi:MAG: hypothetical protein V4858_02325 [Pseudomonadota bacterium]
MAKKIVVIALVAVLAGCVYVAWVISQPSEEPRPFAHAEWEQSALLDTSADPGCFRGGMALDLIDRRTLLGSTAAEVTALLGTPTSASSGLWLYPVGQCGLLWGQHALHVVFGPDAKVTGATLENQPIKTTH